MGNRLNNFLMSRSRKPWFHLGINFLILFVVPLVFLFSIGRWFVSTDRISHNRKKKILFLFLVVVISITVFGAISYNNYLDPGL